MARKFDYLFPESVFPFVSANCKRGALRKIAEKASVICDTPDSVIITSLLDREKLGSTGVGNGVAIPHAKLPEISKIYGFLARLDNPVDFDALDGEPVDLVYILLAPENATAAHLKALAQVSRLMRDEEARLALRGAESADAMFAIAASDRRNNAA